MSSAASPRSAGRPIKNSTNVRSGSAAFAFVSLLSTLAPSVASRWAERTLFVPPRRRPASNRGKDFLRAGIRGDVQLRGGRIATWRWEPPRDRGDGSRAEALRAEADRRDVVVCLHGWGGAASQFGSIVSAIVAKGATAVAFDAPGHGSSSGRTSSILEMRDALVAVAGRLDGPVSIVAHSGGSAAATLAMADGLAVTRAVFIGPPTDPGDWIEQTALASGLSSAVVARVRERTERRLGVPWSVLRILPRAAERSQPLLVIHDRDDHEVPWTDGADLVDTWPGAHLLLTRGLGHRRILHDPVVVKATAQFLSVVAMPRVP